MFNKRLLPSKGIIDLIGYVCIFLFLSINIYFIMKYFKIDEYFMWVPLILSFSVPKLGAVFKYNFSINMSLIVSLITLLAVYISKTNSIIRVFYYKNNNFILTLLIIIFLISRIISGNYKKIDHKETKENKNTLELFNLLYVNISKVHEIAMLIDNKIMQKVEKEQISEDALKSLYSYGIKSNLAISDASIQKETNSKKRVYENFDVKTTKSIMLRKIYDKVKKDSCKYSKDMKVGQLTMFKNVTLQRRNIDETVMILNILQDSNIKNQGDENIEIDINKMMDKILDDFTIDYVFEVDYKDEKGHGSGDKYKYIFQLPYKSNENFENGYQHNDLQIGTLSLIGIYRGEIDFSGKERVSSKFLEIMSNSYNDPMNIKSDNIMKSSTTLESEQSLPFKFKHNKLDGKYHVIDIIAIIQELSIEESQ